MIDAHHHPWDTAVREYAWMDGPWADPLRGSFDVARYRTVAGPRGVYDLLVKPPQAARRVYGIGGVRLPCASHCS